jgi:hypothetical protein
MSQILYSYRWEGGKLDTHPPSVGDHKCGTKHSSKYLNESDRSESLGVVGMSDGFPQNIKLWSHKTRCYVNTLPTQSTIELRLLRSERFNRRDFVTMDFHEYELAYIRSRRDLPCEGGVEYLYRSPASRRRRQKGTSRMWDSKTWSWVPRDSDPRTNELDAAIADDTHPLVREDVM